MCSMVTMTLCFNALKGLLTFYTGVLQQTVHAVALRDLTYTIVQRIQGEINTQV